MTRSVPLGLLVPGLPQPLLVPHLSDSWGRIRSAFDQAKKKVDEQRNAGADLLILYSTQWPSVLGHQIQGAQDLIWDHVDPEFHEMGSIPYAYSFDQDFARAYAQAATKRGLHARSVSFAGFPLDTGTLVARKLLDPENRMAVSVVSCNMYADRAETLVLGKAAADALKIAGRRGVAVAISGLSSRMIPRPILPSEEAISLPGDEEWNLKILEILGQGRLEDVSQLARNFYAEARADQKFKAIWWLSGVMGCHNNYTGTVHAYGTLQGTGAAVVSLEPAVSASADQEFDEDQLEVFRGERAVLSGGGKDSGHFLK